LTVYFISGLGADERVFEKLKLPQNISFRHVHWIEPLKQESLQDYCKRLANQIDSSDEFVIIGMSFGGLAAVELSKIIHPKQIIIISTVAAKKEFPLQFKLLRFSKLYKLIPVSLLRIPMPVLYWFFGVETNFEKQLLKSYIKTVSRNYLSWSIDVVLNWKNENRPANTFHIHGTADRIFPFKRTHADALIKGGGHLMVHNRAEDVSKILSDLLMH
jgi:pimeloyl-ACP methyl ester carboxylesterase